MIRLERNAWRISLLIATVNLAVPPVFNLLANLLVELLAHNSEGEFYLWVSCLALGGQTSFVIFLTWIFFIILASEKTWKFAGTLSVGLLLHYLAKKLTFAPFGD